MRNAKSSSSNVVRTSPANCGLPYFVSGEIVEQDSLLLQTPESLRACFNLDVRVLTEVVAIDRTTQVVRVRELGTGLAYDQPYDALVLSTGASPLKPPIPSQCGLRRSQREDASQGRHSL